MVRMVLGVSAAISWLLCAPQLHAEELYPEPTCKAALGDVWGESSSPFPVNAIAGEDLRSIDDLPARTRTRGAAVTVVKGGEFAGWDFRKARLDGVCFDGSNLAGADFRGTISTGTGFVKANLVGAQFDGAQMTKVLFRNAKLENSLARGAQFEDGHFDGGWFEGSVAGWNLDGANLRGFTFQCGITLDDGCPVFQGGDPISARGADFSGATLHSFGLYNTRTDGALLADTIIGPAQLPYLEKAEIRGDVVLRGGGSDIEISADEAQQLLAEHRKWKTLAAAPSFDCTKAATPVEREICTSHASDLRAADRRLAALYKKLLARGSDVRRDQSAWLRTRNGCAKKDSMIDCLRDSYSDRIGRLLGMMGETNWLPAGGEALFVDKVLHVPSEFRDSALYRKIEPALAGASMSTVFVRRDEDGLYSIVGESIGANAHICSLGAQKLYLDKQTGWYVIVSDGDKPLPVFRHWDGHIEIFESGRPDYETYPDHGDYMGCGMRAAFGHMQRANLADAELDKFRNETNGPH